ncbi:MAG: hypothetical protein SFW62_05380 [Alphaproteobacteria bacterium]|nr:hypothetical protein [Alphaproteobacteria bacterium]
MSIRSTFKKAAVVAFGAVAMYLSRGTQAEAASITEFPINNGLPDIVQQAGVPGDIAIGGEDVAFVMATSAYPQGVGIMGSGGFIPEYYALNENRIPREEDYWFRSQNVGPIIFQNPGAINPVSPADNNFIWFLERNVGVYGKINRLTGEIAKYPLPVDSNPANIVYGPENSVWVLFGNRPRENRYLAMIDPSTGQATKYFNVQGGRSVSASMAAELPGYDETTFAPMASNMLAVLKPGRVTFLDTSSIKPNKGYMKSKTVKFGTKREFVGRVVANWDGKTFTVLRHGLQNPRTGEFTSSAEAIVIDPTKKGLKAIVKKISLNGEQSIIDAALARSGNLLVTTFSAGAFPISSYTTSLYEVDTLYSNTVAKVNLPSNRNVWDVAGGLNAPDAIRLSPQVNFGNTPYSIGQYTP